MIDPQNITNFERTETQLQEFLLFAICVAGKNASVQAKKLDDFLVLIQGPAWPRGFTFYPTHFDNLHCLSLFEIEHYLKEVKMGQYTRISKAFCELSTQRPFLKGATVQGLERIKGIGPKTARFFILHSFPNARCAVLDTHILKYIRERGIDSTAPKTTPSGKRYAELEKKFLDFYDNNYKRFYTLADFDLIIWKYYHNA